MTIIGTDEVGRGCIAGPIVAASFAINTSLLKQIKNDLLKIEKLETKVLTKNKLNRAVRLINHDLSFDKKIKDTYTTKVNIDTKVFQHVYDSKKVTQNNRKIVIEQIIKIGDFGVGVVSNLEIDNKGLQKANIKAMQKSKSNLQYWTSTGPVLYLSDFLKLKKQDIPKTSYKAIIKGDSKSFVIAAASIIAKEYRDSLMYQYHKIYPKYGFNTNVGYGTKAHITAVKKHGLSPIHRKSVKIK